MLVPMAVGMTLSLRTQGVIGALWSYPTVLFFYFALPRRLANLCSLTLLVLATYMVYHYIGMQVTIRFVATLVLCIGVVNIILNIIGELQGQLMSQAITDPLTGVYNRRHLESSLAKAIARHGRSAAPASLLLLDVDCFKQINDQYGHDTGDRVLQGIVALINRRTRVLDQLFRVGGDEFALLLPDTRESDAVTLAEHLRRSVAETPLVDGQPPSVSIGVSELRPGESMDGWMRNADQALYRAKKTGRNQVVSRTSFF
jgi:diguanylate cyclase (GGDEF)-like protein